MESSAIASKYAKNDTPPTMILPVFANVNQSEGILITGNCHEMH